MLTRRSFAAVSLAAIPMAAHGAAARGGVLSTARQEWALGRKWQGDLPHLMDVAQVPAVGYAMVEGGRLTAAATRGLRKAGGDPADGDTRFCAASLTKPVFATIALGLAANGRFDLDRPLQAYLPLFEDPLARTITARHVLSHATGLPNWHYNLLKPLKSDFVPGSRWSYSGEAYFDLLTVLEQVTGETFAALAEEFVFTPSGMRHSTVTWDDKVAANYAWPHDNSGDALEGPQLVQNQAINRYQHAQKIGLPMARWKTADTFGACAANGEKPVPGNAYPNPAFSLWTTPADYARFLLHAAQDKRRWEPVVGLRGDLHWGLGWGLERSADGMFAWHWGDTDGVKNVFMLHLPSQTGVVVFTNGDNGLRIYRRVVRQAFGREFDAFLWV